MLILLLHFSSNLPPLDRWGLLSQHMGAGQDPPFFGEYRKNIASMAIPSLTGIIWGRNLRKRRVTISPLFQNELLLQVTHALNANKVLSANLFCTSLGHRKHHHPVVSMGGPWRLFAKAKRG
jgi:hypothetical protein